MRRKKDKSNGISQIPRREEHLISHLVAGFLAPGSSFFDCRPIRAEVNFLYRPLCHIYSPNYILLFTFPSEYVYIIHLYSQYNSYCR